jgi:hypothetical protein
MIHKAMMNYGLLNDKTRPDVSESYLIGAIQHQGTLQEIAEQAFATMMAMMALRPVMGGNQNQLIFVEVVTVDGNDEPVLKHALLVHFTICNNERGNYPMYVGTKDNKKKEKGHGRKGSSDPDCN